MSNKDKFDAVLKHYGVIKCYVNEVDFNDPRPDGTIFVDVNDINLIVDIYALFTEDGLVDDDQYLCVGYCDFATIEPNYKF